VQFSEGQASTEDEQVGRPVEITMPAKLRRIEDII
jgi:hypothetical protein